MKNTATLLGFISIILLFSSCTSQSYMLMDKDLAYNGVNIPAKPASNFKMVSTKPAGLPANADGKWVAASNPHVVASASRIARVDAIALSAATTVEGHEILKREIEKAMKNSKVETKQTPEKKKNKRSKKASAADSSMLL